MNNEINNYKKKYIKYKKKYEIIKNEQTGGLFNILKKKRK